MATCFIITPIGESGSEIRRNADDLRDLIIKPVLEPLGFTVIRGDHRSEAGQIDIDVIRAVQESDLCIADVSLPNPNVYYEFGRRDETGKPLILLKAKSSEDLPVDVATRRYIEYDLDSRRGIIDATEQLKRFVIPVIKNGFESTGTGASLLELSETLKRIERKIDRIKTSSNGPSIGSTFTGDIGDDTDPYDLLRLALRQRNIPMSEKAMELLSYRMERHRWLDQVVEQVAAMGSRNAGDIMIENAYDFIDNTASFKDKVDFMSCLVSNLLLTDREHENLELVEGICASLKAISAHEPTNQQITVYNQLNRLYFGIYKSTGDNIWLEKAIDSLREALNIDSDSNFLHYNLAICLKNRNSENDTEIALQHALRCIELDGEKPTADHLEEVCELMHMTNDSRLLDYLDKLEVVNPIKARLLKSRWGL